MRAFKRGSLIRDAANPSGGQDMGLGGFAEHGVEERSPPAIAQDHHGRSRWYVLDRPGSIGCMPTVDNHLWDDVALVQDLIDVGGTLLFLRGLIGIDLDRASSTGCQQMDEGTVIVHMPRRGMLYCARKL